MKLDRRVLATARGSKLLLASKEFRSLVEPFDARRIGSSSSHTIDAMLIGATIAAVETTSTFCQRLLWEARRAF